MKLPGTHVTAEDVEGAVALRFENAAQADELRRRVGVMAQHHQSAQAMECPMHEQASQAAAPSAHASMHSADVKAETTESGARLVFTPRQPAELDALRQAVHTKSQHMRDGGCAMMHAGPAAEQHAH